VQQVIQDIRKGRIALRTIPAPCPADGEVLIANRASLVSAGTEKMALDLGKRTLLGKARERPDQVRRVLEKLRTEGVVSTFQQVMQKLDEPMTMGYSSAGIVLACGRGIQDLKPGDRVASNGPHAEVVSVPRNLCARIPDAVSFESACFGVLGSIALQGVRLTKCQLGETVLVIGLGLIGQLTVALLKAAGIRVLGIDLDERRCELAKTMGAEDARPDLGPTTVNHWTGDLGADAVIITASTRSNAPIETAAATVRKKGRIVLVGVVGLELDRRPFYFKEVEFVVSCSYGPGRYDASYEQRGHDYPAAYVRWTENRNIQAVLDLMGAGQLPVERLITHRFPIEEAEKAYELIEQSDKPFLGIVLNCASPEDRVQCSTIQLRPTSSRNGKLRCGVLGAGNFARMVLLPAIRDCGQFEISKLCSGKGVSAEHVGRSYGAESVCTDEAEVFNDPSIGAVFSVTRHDLHARHVIQAIEARKHIFVEKPLCVAIEELEQIEATLNHAGQAAPLLMVGFNRRFSPAADIVRKHFANVPSPLTVSIRFNAGGIPADHWTQQPEEGGGRIIGEACHAIDLATFLCNSLPVRVFAESIGHSQPNSISDDQCFITLRHADGSVSSIAYLAGGDRSCSKERVEVFGGGRAAIIDDFGSVTTFANGKSKTIKARKRKGHREEIQILADTLKNGGDAPISWPEIKAVTLASILAVQSLRDGLPMWVKS
jgi:predicted dehydrogenase/threonine dehydrogenase-like Zn-dependent dehydrogenase